MQHYGYNKFAVVGHFQKSHAPVPSRVDLSVMIKTNTWLKEKAQEKLERPAKIENAINPSKSTPNKKSTVHREQKTARLMSILQFLSPCSLKLFKFSRKSANFSIVDLTGRKNSSKFSPKLCKFSSPYHEKISSPSPSSFFRRPSAHSSRHSV
uniref:Uncharacterized protein n=1 Tax=Romanomermis culicivorax TaxID=13658 RepID=A0A915L4U8_ROMCU